VTHLKVTQKSCPAPKKKTLQHLTNSILRKLLRKTISRLFESDLLARPFCSVEEKAYIKFFF